MDYLLRCKTEINGFPGKIQLGPVLILAGADKVM